jgi:hypothetical protein
MKIIDMYRSGRLIRFFLGKDDMTDFSGDDWDDSPYEHNAGTVYDEYVSEYVDVVVPFSMELSEPKDSGGYNSGVSRDMQKARSAPLLLVRPSENSDDLYPYDDCSYRDIAADQNSVKIWIGDKPDVLDKIGITIGKVTL